MQKFKRTLSLLLALVMVLGMLPQLHTHTHAAEATYPVLETDTKTNVTVPEEGERVYFQYTPQYTEKHTVYTTGGYDTVCWIYDSDMNMIIENDDSGNSYNCSVTYPLEAGVTYIIAFSAWDIRDAATFPVYITIEHNVTTTVIAESSCMSPGEIHCVCQDCGLEYDEYKEPTGHSFVDGVCTVCNAEGVDSGVCGKGVAWTPTAT